MALTDMFNIGRPVFELGTSSGSSSSMGSKYPPLSKEILLVLADKDHITAKAIAVLQKEYTFDEAVQLYDNDDIVDEDTFVLVTGKLPPAQKNQIIYGEWRDVPALPPLANPAQMTWVETTLPISESFIFGNDFRASVGIEWRPKLQNDTDVWPGAARGEKELYFRVNPDNIAITSNSSNKKRTYTFTGKAFRRHDTATSGYNPGELEFRYIITPSRKAGA